jgi:hypothetical protein
MSVHQETLDSTKRAQRKRKDLAAQKRAKIIAQMTVLQKNFIEQNAQICSDVQDKQDACSQVDETSPPSVNARSLSTDTQLTSTIASSQLSTSEWMLVEPTIIQSCLSTHDADVTSSRKQILTCIFCQESSEVKLNAEALVLSAYVQKYV